MMEGDGEEESVTVAAVEDHLLRNATDEEQKSSELLVFSSKS